MQLNARSPMRGYHMAILLANVRHGLAASASEQPAKQRKVKHETYQKWVEQYNRECQAVLWLDYKTVWQ